MVGVALYRFLPALRHSDRYGCDAGRYGWCAGRMYAAPEGADAANVMTARSGQLSSMVRCAHSYVHDGPSSSPTLGSAGRHAEGGHAEGGHAVLRDGT
jgi:hypothetical protein